MTSSNRLLVHLGPAVILVLSLLSGQDEALTYHKNIAPLLSRSCFPCHQANGHGPFELTSYGDIKKRLELFRTVVMSREMPPFRAHSDFEAILKQPLLSDEELVIVQKWIQQGAREGDPGPVSPPQSAGFEATASIVVGQKSKVEEEGTPYWIAYPYEAATDMLVSAMLVETSAPRAVRQVMLAKDLSRWKTDEPIETNVLPPTDFEPILVWAAGQGIPTFPRGLTAEVKKGDRLWIQVLYVPTGKSESAEVKVKLRGEEGRIVQSKLIQTNDILIAPNKDKQITQVTTLDKPMSLVAIMPFARFFAIQVTITARLPGARTKTLLHVTSWNPIWIGTYVFSKPIELPKGTVITATIDYDNSEHAPVNEGTSSRPVIAGLKRTDETFAIYLVFGTQ